MKAVTIVIYVFSIVGIGLLAGACLMAVNARNLLADASFAEGEVVDLRQSRSVSGMRGVSQRRSESSDSISYHPVISFRAADGSMITFSSPIGSNPPGYYIGETVEVLYHSSNPQKARINSFVSLWAGPLLLGGLGLVFFIIGFSIILVTRLKAKNIKSLKDKGVPVQTKFESVGLNESVSVNGRSPYVIFTQWINPATSRIHIFKSENIWFDPSGHIPEKDITVLIEQGNPEKYYVDTSFLPRLG